MEKIAAESKNDFSSKLDLTDEEIRQTATEVIEFVAEYYESIRNLRIYPSATKTMLHRSFAKD